MILELADVILTAMMKTTMTHPSCDSSHHHETPDDDERES